MNWKDLFRAIAGNLVGLALIVVAVIGFFTIWLWGYRVDQRRFEMCLKLHQDFTYCAYQFPEGASGRRK